jgi:2-C-methyl-D-erythritol 4-phosphate cytidylyltransferase
VRPVLLLAAAGSGERLGGGVPKQYLPLCGTPILRRSYDVFDASGGMARAVVVVPPGDEARAREILSGGRMEVSIVPGGRRRQDSVLAGLRAVGEAPAVLIHDAVRPLVTAAEIAAVIAAVAECGAVLAAPVTDTLKRSRDGEWIDEEVPRAGLFAMQTPQGFPFPQILHAYEQAAASGREFTDDTEPFRAAGGRVAIVRGSQRNLKVTTKEDLLLAEEILSGRTA